MSIEKIKVSAPRKNPHICYISEQYRSQISTIKEKTGKSLYSILCEVSGKKLETTEQIHAFKKQLKSEGFRNIGEWAECLIDFLYEKSEDIKQIDLSSIKFTRKSK